MWRLRGVGRVAGTGGACTEVGIGDRQRFLRVRQAGINAVQVSGAGHGFGEAFYLNSRLLIRYMTFAFT